MDEAERRAWSEMGFDPDEVVRNQARREESLGMMWDLLMHGAGAETDPWTDREALLAPFVSPFPVEVVGEPDLDPLVFTVELARPATTPEVEALTTWIAELGREAARDDDDHVSFWSPATATRTPDTGLPAVAWWFDAAAASPRLLRRLVARTLVGLTEIGLPATFLFVGHNEG